LRRAHDLGKYAEERLPHGAYECEIRVPISACQLIEEDSADSARLLPVRQIEILIAGLLEFR
jgi:hypothetical protein